MGTNFSQSVVFGISANIEDIKVVSRPAEYKMQDRYDPRTGKITHQENVCVKYEEYFYDFCGQIASELDMLELEIREAYPDVSLWTDYDFGKESQVVVGIGVGENEDMGRVELVRGSVSVEELEILRSKLESYFPDISPDQFKLHFIPYVG